MDKQRQKNHKITNRRSTVKLIISLLMNCRQDCVQVKQCFTSLLCSPIGVFWDLVYVICVTSSSYVKRKPAARARRPRSVGRWRACTRENRNPNPGPRVFVWCGVVWLHTHEGKADSNYSAAVVWLLPSPVWCVSHITRVSIPLTSSFHSLDSLQCVNHYWCPSLFIADLPPPSPALF